MLRATTRNGISKDLTADLAQPASGFDNTSLLDGLEGVQKLRCINLPR
jgi:hypothetical protein